MYSRPSPQFPWNAQDHHQITICLLGMFVVSRVNFFAIQETKLWKTSFQFKHPDYNILGYPAIEQGKPGILLRVHKAITAYQIHGVESILALAKAFNPAINSSMIVAPFFYTDSYSQLVRRLSHHRHGRLEPRHQLTQTKITSHWHWYVDSQHIRQHQHSI
jgi:hypothetical protein